MGGQDSNGEKKVTRKPSPSGENAMEYLDMVKAELAGRPQVYNEFLHVMVMFRKGNIDANTVVQRVYSLFEGKNNLVQNFQTFLPEGCTIDMSPDAEGNCMPTVRFSNEMMPATKENKNTQEEEDGDSKMPAATEPNDYGDERRSVDETRRELPAAEEDQQDEPVVGCINEIVSNGERDKEEVEEGSKMPAVADGEDKKDETSVDQPPGAGETKQAGAGPNEDDLPQNGDSTTKPRAQSISENTEDKAPSMNGHTRNGQSKESTQTMESLSQDTNTRGPRNHLSATWSVALQSLEESFRRALHEAAPMNHNDVSTIMDPSALTLNDMTDTVDHEVARAVPNRKRTSRSRPVPVCRRKHLVLSVPPDSRRRHKEILLRLFSRYTAAELERLGKETGAQLRALDPPSQKERLKRSTILSHLPKIMINLQGSMDEEMSRKARRDDYVARDLRAVENETRAWHSSQLQTQVPVTSFALQFNECSLAAVSKWAACVESKASSQKRQVLDPSRYHHVDPKFRLCLSCRLWGHYESECCNCVHQPFPEHVKRRKRPRNGRVLTGQGKNKKYVMVVESCEGQAIEQRSDPAQPLWSSDSHVTSQIPVTTTEIDGSFITAMASRED